MKILYIHWRLETFINPNKGDCGVGHHPLSFYVLLLNFALVKILNFF